MWLLSSTKNLLTMDLAVDMGTTRTRVSLRGKGVVLNEPSCIAISYREGEVVAVGREAFRLFGKHPPHVQVATPLSHGVIEDLDVSELLLKSFIERAFRRKSLFGARMVVVVPAQATDVEKKAFEDVAIQAGARHVILVESPIACALGLGLPVDKTRGVVLLNLGGGTTQAAVFSGGEMFFTRCERVGGEDLNEAIVSGIRKKYGILVGHHTVENIKISLGSAYPMEQDETREVYGKDVIDGLPKAIFISNWEVREMILSPLESIINTVKSVLEDIPPELSEDVKKTGLYLTGGNAMVRGMGRLIEDVCGVRAIIARKSTLSSIAGAERVLSDLRANQKFTTASNVRRYI
jgi:rod shape-determining protein MreB and related proteins